MTFPNFPANPELGDEYTYAGKTWVFDGVGWGLPGILSSGLWTPEITLAVPGDLDIAYSVQSGWWRKQRDLVFLSCRVQGTVTYGVGASGAWRVLGLPFPCASVSGQEAGALRYIGVTKANYTDFSLINIQNEEYLETRAAGSGMPSAVIDVADIPTGTIVLFNCELMYLTTE